MANEFRHVVVTRYAIHTRFNRPGVNWKHKDADWLSHRRGLFERFTMPGMQSQTCQDFEWILLVDPIVTDRPTVERATWLDYKSRDDLADYLERTYTGQQWLLSSRLDSDDCYLPSFIAAAQSEFREQEEWINPRLGFRVRDKKTWTTSRPHNPMQTAISKWRGSQTVLPYDVEHTKTKPRDYSVDTPLWTQILHDRNVCNGVESPKPGEFTCIRCRKVRTDPRGKCRICRPAAVAADLKHAICKTNQCGFFDAGCTHPDMGKPSKTRDHLLMGRACVAGTPLFGGSSIDHTTVNLSTIRAADSHVAARTSLVTFHFNPCRFQRLSQTHSHWWPTLGPLQRITRCYELVFDDDTPEIPGSIVIRGTRAGNLMWQKEALINLAMRETPDHVRYFGWIDHDIILRDPNWLSRAAELIDNGAPAVQLFDSLHYLGKNREKTETTTTAPGGAWLADRSFLDRVGGLCDTAIVGSGDQTFRNAVTNHSIRHVKRYSDAMAEDHRRYAAKMECEKPAKQLQCEAYHVWHGERRNRQYGTRDKILRRHGFDPATDVKKNSRGIWEWSSDKPQLHEQVAKFFHARREDA